MLEGVPSGTYGVIEGPLITSHPCTVARGLERPMTISDHRDLVAALLGVPGVAAAAVEPVGDGPGTLRLQLASGADEVDVAGAVNRLLRSRFGLAVDSDRVRVVDGDGLTPDA